MKTLIACFAGTVRQHCAASSPAVSHSRQQVPSGIAASQSSKSATGPAHRSGSASRTRSSRQFGGTSTEQGQKKPDEQCQIS